MIDSHCHLGSHKFTEAELPGIIHAAEAAGVHQLVTLATDLNDIPTNLAIAERSKNVHCCIGIHPCDVHETADDFRYSIESLTGNPRVAAIGETGLDYFHPAPDGWSDDTYRQRQKDFLIQHFEIAERAGLNIVIHTRDKTGQNSFEDALSIYETFSENVRAVFHCFIFDLEAAKRVIDLGGLVSFTGIATFKKPGHVLDVATALPAGTFMVETDAPYLAPMPHRGKRNEPAYVAHTAHAIATARGESIETLDAHTSATAKAFFRGL